MIRFCDKEICCAALNELNWQQMLDYFLDWHMDEKVYILDENGKFIGSVNYNALFGVKASNAIHMEYIDLDENKKICVVTDYVILDKTIWEKGREYFRICPGGLLPVVDNENQLVCFAWNDDEANREIRMLDELMDCDNALDFRTVYPEADCVTIQGCNELAYYFAQYLKQSGISVNLSGDLWDELSISENAEVPDYRNLIVYAEGCADIQKEKGLRKSVSPEFECIDRIYEENIMNGNIKDADGSFDEFLKRVKGRQIGIDGIENISLDAYDLLVGYGLDICCFVSDRPDLTGKELFGKKILTQAEVMEEIEDFVFVYPQARYSAWGGAGIDFCHYCGYKRNERCFLLQDYTEIPQNGYLNILKRTLKETENRLILMGDFWLCLKLGQILSMSDERMRARICYYDVLNVHREKREELRWISKEEVSANDTCLLLLPGYYGRYADVEESRQYRDSVKEKYLQTASRYSVANVIDYPVENAVFMDAGKPFDKMDSDIKVKGIVLGSIEDHSGNVFFRGLLDAHPEILMMSYNYLNENLFSICIRLSVEKKENILSLLWRFYGEESQYHGEDGWGKAEIKKFNDIMEELMSVKDRFTSQELFIMVHIAYARVWMKNIVDISDMIIYWEPHNMSRENLENYAVWLSGMDIMGNIINVVRNSYVRRGSNFKDLEKKGWSHGFNQSAFVRSLVYMEPRKKKYIGWKRITVRFEDLKCNPRKELMRICEKWGIRWSDTLLETTHNGEREFYNQQVTGFDLAPVYRTYEEYYSAFDRFRIMLITGPWLKKNGYPYVSSLEFSRRELQEMYEKEFRFEKNFIFSLLEDRIKIRNLVQKQISRDLWKVRRDEIMEKISLEEKG